VSNGPEGNVETLAGLGTQSDTLAGDATLGSSVDAEGAWDTARIGPGLEIGPFLVQRVLGRGAMGLVVLAQDRELDRPVAIKLLLKAGSEIARARLMREAQSTARLSHPNVVAVHRVGTFEGQVYVVMEYVDGGTLRDYASQPGRTWEQIVAAYVQAGRGLAAAHAAGFVHRDFKPDNVLVGRDGRVRVTDFGLVTAVASAMEPPRESTSSASGFDPNDRLTHGGAVLGTPAYMAPEQFGTGQVDPRADQFSYCVSLFEALFGRRPFEGSTAANFYVAIAEGRVSSVSCGQIPQSVHAAVVRGLAFDPAERWPSMEALLAALEVRPVKRGPSPVAVGLGVGAAVVMLGGGSVAYWMTASPAAAACSEAGVKIASIWNDDARGKLRSALQRSERADADEMTDLVEARIDEFVETWIGMHEAACEATLVRKEQSERVLDLRHACLERSEVEIDALLALLRESEEPRVLAAAPGLLDVLTPLVRCGDIEALRREGIDASPSDEAREALRMLVWASGLAKAGLWAEAEPLVDETVRTAEALGDPRITARAYNVRVETRYAMDDGPGAVAAAEASIRISAQARAHDVEAAARVMLLHSAAMTEGFPTRASTLIAEAMDATGRAKDDLAMARLHGTTAQAYLQLGDAPRAEASIAQALGFYEDLEDRIWSERSAARLLRASLFMSKQRFADAIDEAERAREIAVKGLGPTHPYVALSLGTRGGAEGMAGAHQQAMATLLEALPLWRRAYGSTHPGLVVLEGRLAALAHSLGQRDVALDHVEGALALLDQIEPEPGPQRAQLLDRRAALLLEVHRHADAAETLKSLIAIQTQLHGPDHPVVVEATRRLDQARAELTHGDH
jgi:eukaryotic-like serine/threonine-protein kinase